MILADKIIELRKKAGYSQEELAEKMGVSRQSVSKWEGALSIPDLDKILLLSEIFGVSTDYLLKDELGDEIPIPQSEISESSFRKITLEEATEFIMVKDKTAPMVALGTLLCILSPISLFIMIYLYEVNKFTFSEDMAVGIGLIITILMVIPAVALFIASGMKTSKFEYIETEPLELAYGVAGMLKERKLSFHDNHIKNCVIGICLCIVSAIPLFVSIFFKNPEANVFIGLSFTLAIVALGTYILIKDGIPWCTIEKLLQEGDYTIEKKSTEKKLEPIATIYWCVVLAIYLGWSFVTNDWDFTWIVWPVAAVLYGAFYGIASIVNKK